MSATNNDAKRYVSIVEAAEYAGLSDGTIRNLIAMQQLTAFRPVPGRIVIDLQELDRFVRESAGKRCTRGREGWGQIQPAPAA